MATAMEGIIAVLLAALVVGTGVTMYGAFQDEPVVVIPDPIVEVKEVTVDNPETQLALDAANAELNSLKDKYADEERELYVCGLLVDWAEDLDLADKYDDELALALNVSEDDLNDYEFTLNLDKCKFADFDEDDDDYTVVLGGEIKWEDDDGFGDIEITLNGVVEDDDDLDDEEILFPVI